MAAAPVLESPPFSAEAAPARAPGRRRPLNVLGPVDRAQPQVLVVEPDAKTRALLQLGLSREGFEVTGTASAEEALRLLTPERPLPSMIFAEAGLQSADGFSFCSRVRSDERTAGLPVVILSASPDPWHRELAGAAGADQYLPKPLFLNDVVAVAKLMAGQGAHAASYAADTGYLPLFAILRALLSGARAGRIALEEGGGVLGFRDGVVVEAAWSGSSGVEALRRMLLLAEGAYTVTFGPSLTRSTMTFGLEELCGKLGTQLARWRRLEEIALPLEARLTVDFARLVEELVHLPDEVNALVRLFDGHRTMRDVVMDAPLDEVTALEAATRLYVMGVIAPPANEAGPQSQLQPQEQSRVDSPSQVESPAPVEAPPLPAPVPSAPLPLVPPLVTRMIPPEALVAFAQGALPAPDTDVAQAVETWAEPEASLVPSRRAYARAGVVSALIVAAAAVLAFVAWPRSDSPTPVGPPVVVAEARAPAIPAAEAPDPEPTVDPGFPLLQAIAHYDAGRLQQAVTALERVTRDFPRSPQAWVYLGLAQFDLGQNREAERSAARALELEPENGRALMLLATIDVDEGQREKAEVTLQRYLTLEPDGPYARDARQLLRR